jgi:hypothetical protein
VLLAINLTLLVFVAAVAARAFTRDAEPWRLALATVAGMPLLTWVVTLSLGAFGVLWPVTATIFLAVIAGLLLPQARLLWKDSPAAGERAITTPFWIVRLATAVCLAAIIVTGAKLLLRGSTMSAEDLLYHAPFAANALRSGSFAENSLLWMEFYPFNADLTSLWLFLLGGTDGAAVLAGAFWAILLGVSGGMVVKALGGSRASALVTVALLVGSLIVRGEAERFASADLAGAAMFLAAVAFLVPGDALTPRYLRSVLLAGLLAGWAAGSKILFVPPVLVVALWLLFGSWRSIPLPRRFTTVAIYLAAAAVTGSFWYVRALVATGDPAFPGSIGPFHGPFTSWHQWQTSFLRQIVQGRLFSRESLPTLGQYLEWPVGLWVISFSGVVRLIWGGLLSLLNRKSGARNGVLLLVLVALASSVLFPLLPFSGTYDVPDGELIAVPRYLILPFAAGVVAFMHFWGGGRAVLVLCSVLALVSLANGGPVFALASAVVACAGYLWGDRLVRTTAGLRGRPAVIVAVIVFGCVALWVPYARLVADENMFSSLYFDDERGGSYRFLETLPPGSRITWFGPSNEYYPLYGRRLQFIPVVVDPDGSWRPPLRRQWEQDPGGVQWWGQGRPPDPGTLAHNLRSLGIDYVVVQKVDGLWPVQDRLLDTDAEAPLVYGDSANRVRRLRSDGAMVPLQQDTEPQRRGDRGP